MRTQVYVSSEQTDEFIQSINHYRKLDPRLNNPQFANLLNISAGFFGKLLKKKERLSEHLYNLWFDEIELKLARRIENYQKTGIDKMIEQIKNLLPEKREEVEKTLLISDDRIKLALKRRRIKSILNIYDVLNAKPLYNSPVDNMVEQNIAIDDDQALINETLSYLKNIAKSTGNIKAINHFLCPQKPNIYTGLLRSPYHHLREDNRSALKDTMDDLKTFEDKVNEVTTLLGNAKQIRISKIEKLTNKTVRQLIDDCNRFFNSDKFLINYTTKAPVISISRRKAITLIATEKMVS